MGIFAFFKNRPDDASVPTDEGPVLGIPDGREQEYCAGIDPRHSDKPVMYTLHTCRHCARLKTYLEQRGVFVQEVYLDDFASPARHNLMEILKKYNPRASFPTLVLSDGRFVVGFREAAIRAMFGWKD